MKKIVKKSLTIALGVSISMFSFGKDRACRWTSQSSDSYDHLAESNSFVQDVPGYREPHKIVVNTSSGVSAEVNDGKCSLYEALLAAQLKTTVDTCQNTMEQYAPFELIVFRFFVPTTITPDRPIRIPTPEATARTSSYPSIVIDGGGIVTIDGSKIVQDLGANLLAIGRKVAPSIFMIGSGEGFSSIAPSIHQDCIDVWARFWPDNGGYNVYPDGAGPWTAHLPYAAAYTLKGLTIKNGSAMYGGAIYTDAAHLILAGMSFENNFALYGGAIARRSESGPWIDNWMFMPWNFERNYFVHYTTGRGLRIYDSSFAGNTALEGGGAIYNWKAGNHVEGMASLYIGGSSFVLNKSEQGPGGAILSENVAKGDGKNRFGASVEIHNSTFIDNMSASKMAKDDKGNNVLVSGGSAIATRGFESESNEVTLTHVTLADRGKKENVNNVLLFKANPNHFMGVYNTVLWDNNTTSLGCASPLSGYSNIAWPDKMGTCGVASVQNPLFSNSVTLRTVKQAPGDSVFGVDRFIPLILNETGVGYRIALAMLIPPDNSPLRDAGNPAFCGESEYYPDYLPKVLYDKLLLEGGIDMYLLLKGGQVDKTYVYDQDKMQRPQGPACDIGAWEISSFHAPE